MSPLKRLFQLIQADRKDITRIFLFAALSGLINLTLPLGIQAIITYLMGGMISTSWVLLVIFVISGVILAGVMQVMQLSLSETIEQRIFHRSAFEFAIRIPRIKLEQVASKYAPELINRFFDTLSLQKGLSKILLDTGAALLQIIFGLMLLSFYHPFFILFGVILIMVLYLVLRLTGPQGLKTSIEESTYKYKVAYWLEELARTMNTFKLAGETRLPEKRTDELLEKYLGARRKHFKILVFQYLNIVGFKALVAGGLLVIGSLLVLDNQINLGQFVAAEIVIILILNSAEKLIRTMEPVYEVLTALEKIASITDLELERENGELFYDPNAPHKPLSISVSNLCYTNSFSGHMIIKDINLEIAAGERVLVHGYSGSGKSTLLELLAGLYQNYEGTLCYNDIPASSLNLRSLRSQIGDSLGEEDIFEGTIEDNIMLGKAWLSKEHLHWASEKIGLLRYVKKLPLGYQTLLSPKGSGIPEHIVRKIMIARSIIEQPPLVIWQESMYTLPKDDKSCIIDCMMNKKHPWTLIVSSASKKIAERCDRIIILNEGFVEYNGTPEEVLSNPELKELFYD